MPVFASARREHKCINSVELEKKRANPVPGLVNKYVERQLRAGVAFAGFGFNIAKIVVATG